MGGSEATSLGVRKETRDRIRVIKAKQKYNSYDALLSDWADEQEQEDSRASEN